MRLATFRIKNFKSVVDTGTCNFSDVDNIVVLAGQNEAGKSAVIEALDFFRNGPSDDFAKLQKRREENPEVECEFVLSKEDIENVFIESENDELKKELTTNNRLKFIRCVDDEDTLDSIFFVDDTEERLAPFFEVPTAPAAAKSSEVPVAGTVELAVPVAGTGEVPVPVAPEPVPTATAPYSLEDLLGFLTNEMREFVFYDSFDALLPGIVTVKDIPNHTAVQDFEQVFNVKFTDIVNKDERGIRRAEMALNEKASDDLNNYWTQKLEKDSKYNFTVKIVPKVPVEESTIEFMIDRADGDPLYLEQKSNGFRWFSSFNMRLRALGVKDTTIQNLVILIDEPGQGLHEKAQKDLKKVLEELGEKGAQIIYTTHYPNLIGTVGKEFARIRLVSNTNGHGTKAETVAQFASRADVGASDALSPLITAMGIQSVGSFLDRDLLNVVVEGITDHYYLSAFCKILNKDKRLRFIPACGVTNVPNLVSVLIGWGLNYKAVFDDDAGSGRKAYTLLKKEFYENDDVVAHEHILKISNCNGIEDIFTSKDFHKLVLNTALPTASVPINSELAKGRKEALGRLFLEKAEAGSITLDRQTTTNVENVFTWLYQKFGI